MPWELSALAPTQAESASNVAPSQPVPAATTVLPLKTCHRVATMGASDSKLVFKKGIFRLSEERHIPADDPYWTSVSPPAPTAVSSSNVALPVLGAPRVFRRHLQPLFACRHPAYP